ncbi:glutaminase [Bradyrhizobium sp. McL0615]|uniref:glutaminase n=1 Tax=Bradyrhizobium sp. McL0615 TaxID=3415673 RepID=UPI003CE6C37F
MKPSPTPTARFVSTGTLPGRDEIRSLVEAAYVHFREEADGQLADYIPALAEADPSAFGICVADTRGDAFVIGDAALPFSIQSVSNGAQYLPTTSPCKSPLCRGFFMSEDAEDQAQGSVDAAALQGRLFPRSMGVLSDRWSGASGGSSPCAGTSLN